MSVVEEKPVAAAATAARDQDQHVRDKKNRGRCRRCGCVWITRWSVACVEARDHEELRSPTRRVAVPAERAPADRRITLKAGA